MIKLLLSLFAISSLLRADFEPKDWRYRVAISASPTAALSRITLDPAIYVRSCAQSNDMRVVRDGSEIAYELLVSADNREEQNLMLKIVNKSVVPGRGLQAVLDLNGHPQHNRLRIATTQQNFKETMRIETSDDGHRWSVVRSEALIFDISREDRKISDLTAEYPVSTRRYVRLTIPGWNDPAFLQHAWLLQVAETKAIRDRVASLTPSVAQDGKNHTTSYTFDIGFAGQPYDELEFAAGSDLFFRNVEVFTSNTAKDWTFAGATVLSNRPDDIHLQFQLPEQWSRYLKLVIANGDSPPVTVNRMNVFALRRTMRFSTARTGRYWLYTGKTAAQAPRYDLTPIVASKVAAVFATLGSPEDNPDYQAPTLPWSDRNRHLLTGLVIAAAALMAYITVRLLVRTKAA